jgi:hypothetical protein
MQPKLIHRDESAWEMGDLAYDLGDTMEIAVQKATKAGIRPGANGYAAFITAFGRRVRSKQVSPLKAQQPEPTQSTSAVVLTPDFQRSGS